MKRKMKSQQRVLSFLLVLAMLIGSMGITGWGTGTAYAEGGDVSAEVYLSFQDGGFTVRKQAVTVSSTLAETYGYTDSVSSGSGVSALDVLVKAHEIKMGIDDAPDQTNINKMNAMLSVSSSGFITVVMGESTSNFGFTVNGKVPNDGTIGSYGYNGYTVNQAQVKKNDNIEFFIYQDDYALDYYSWFEQNGIKVEDITVLPGSNVELSLKGYCIGYYGLKENTSIYYISPDAEIVTIGSNGATVPWTGKMTDDDGNVTLSFSTPGNFVVSAVADEYDVPLIMPWLDVKVIDPNANLPGNIPTEDVSAYVTITDADNTYVTKQALEIGWFDIRPFMTSGAESYALSDQILTANALIEGVYYKLYGKDPTRGDLAVSMNSTTAQAIRANLSIYNGSWGLSTGSVFGNSNLVMSAINDNFGEHGIGGDKISTGDNIVFYSYDNEYSYFNVMKIETGSVTYDKVYPVFNIKLKVLKKTYPSTVEPVSGAGIYVAGESWCYATTGVNGVVNAEFMRGDSSSGELLITAKGNGIIQPYLRILYTWDGSQVGITSVSQGLIPDTSLSSFTVNAYGTVLDASDYSDHGFTFDVNADIENVTLTAIASDSDASLGEITISGSAVRTVNFASATGGSVTIPLNSGLNQLSFQVTNGQNKETYSLTINRSSSASNMIADVNRVINGIADYTAYNDSTYDYNWIIAKTGAGKEINASEKQAFLTQTVNHAESLEVGSAAKTVIALTALNIDATKVPSKDSGNIIDLVAKVYNDSDSTIPYISYLPYMLMMEDLGSYTIPEDAKWGREELIQYALDHYSGGTGWSTANGIDYAAIMIPALAPYYKNADHANGYNGISQASCAAIKVKVDEVIGQFRSLQKSNGSFDNNSDSTAAVIAALSSLGIDPDGADFTQKASGKSVLEAIFAYETSDHRLGHTNKSYSDFASKDGLQALASYLEYYAGGAKNGDGCIYRFIKEIKPYTKWPDADLLTGIKISTPPVKKDYSYDASETNYPVDTEGMVVTGIFNGDTSNTTTVAISACTVSTVNRAIEGSTQTVTVTYQGYTATFMINVLKKDGTLGEKDTVSVKVKSSSKEIAADNSVVIEDGKTTAMDVLKRVLDKKGVNYIIKGGNYVSEIDGLGEFDKGKNSGWLYKVNDDTPSTTAASEYKLKAGDDVVWYYTLDYTKDKSSSGWTTPEAEKSKKGISNITVTAKTDASGKAVAEVSSKEISTAIAEAVASAKESGKETKSEVRITVEGADKASSVEASIPAASMKELKSKVDVLTVKSPVANIRFDSDSLGTLAKEAAGEVKVTAVKLRASDLKNLTEEVQAELGDKPVFDFSIQSGSKTIAQFNGKAVISVPYIPTAQEQGKGLVVYYISDNGKLEMIRDCVYDPETKTMTFTVNHFSKYALGYKAVPFTDVTSHWAKDYITYLAAREVITGMTTTTFAPNSNITRAQFVQILANLSGADLNSYSGEKASAFQDVEASDWYAKAVVWAAEQGIAAGTAGRNGTVNFQPNANITRQDMAVMLSRYAEKAKRYSLKAANSPAAFLDGSQIADYAKEAVTQLQRAGLVKGKTGGAFAPKEPATRAECAKMISVLMESAL